MRTWLDCSPAELRAALLVGVHPLVGDAQRLGAVGASAGKSTDGHVQP